MEMTSSHRKRFAFTLIELLVVIAIIAILAAIFIPSLSRAQHEGRRTACASNLRQIGLAVKSYLSDSQNVFPPVLPAQWDRYGLISDYYRPHAGDNYDIFRCPAQRKDLRSRNSGLAFPSDPGKWTSYEFNSFFAYPSNSYVRTATRRDVTDASICAYVYDYPYYVWGDGTDDRPHKAGMNVLYLDWHVSWLPADQYEAGGVWFYNRGHL